MSMNLTQTTTTCDVYDLGCSNQKILKYYFNQALQRKKMSSKSNMQNDGQIKKYLFRRPVNQSIES